MSPLYFFFFSSRRRHTRLQGDWSSDVCSSDLDDWRAAGNPGWSFSELLPYFRKLEDHAWGLSEFHGAAGPVHVSDVSGSVHPLCTSFLEEIGRASCRERV